MRTTRDTAAPGRVVAVLVTALSALLTAACGAAGPPAADSSSATAASAGVPSAATSSAATSSAATSSAAGVPIVTDLPVVVFRNRGDDLKGIFEVKVTNTGDERLRIGTVTLRTAAYEASAPVVADAIVGPGLRVDIRVPVGAPVCTAGASVPTAEVDLTIGGVDDPPADLAPVTAQVQADQLVKWNERECRVQLVSQLVSATFAENWTESTDDTGRPALDGLLRVEVDAGAGAVEIAAVDRTTLFATAVIDTAAPDLPATLHPGQRRDLAVRMLAGRCDPHAVAEDKYGYVFPVRISVGGAEAVVVPVTVPVPQRAPLADLITRSCSD